MKLSHNPTALAGERHAPHATCKLVGLHVTRFVPVLGGPRLAVSAPSSSTHSSSGSSLFRVQAWNSPCWMRAIYL